MRQNSGFQRSQRLAQSKYLVFRRMMRDYLRLSYERSGSLDVMTKQSVAAFRNTEGWQEFLSQLNRRPEAGVRFYASLDRVTPDTNPELCAYLGTVAQLPYVLGLRDLTDADAIGWAALFLPRRLKMSEVDDAPRLRATFDEMRSMMDAGVPLWMAERFDTGERAYPVEVVTEAYLNGYPDEFVWALLGGEPS